MIATVIGHWAPLLREEARLAALLGDREGAIRAYQLYLALRSKPEPELMPEVERVRAELGRLWANSGRNGRRPAI